VQQTPPKTVWSRRPPLRFLTACRASKGVSASGGFRQRGRVGSAHTGRYADITDSLVRREAHMADLSRDPIINVVYNQIKRGIRVALENECYASVVILIYSR
jgi:hypothetical protein